MTRVEVSSSRCQRFIERRQQHTNDAVDDWGKCSHVFNCTYLNFLSQTREIPLSDGGLWLDREGDVFDVFFISFKGQNI